MIASSHQPDSAATASVFIGLREALDEAAWCLMERRLRDVPGVVAPWFNPDSRHMLLVYYNPEKTRALTLLRAVRACGYHASLVSL